MRTYEQFKKHLTTFVWRPTDTVLRDSLDDLVAMAEAELNRKLTLQRRDILVEITVDGNEFLLSTLATPMRTLKSLAAVDCATEPYSQTTVEDVLRKRSAGHSKEYPLYALSGGGAQEKLLFTGAGSRAFWFEYTAALPDYAETDTSWVAEDYLDLFTYTVLSHSAPFLREDDRLATWAGLKADALESALEEDAFGRTHGGSPLKQQAARKSPRR